MKKSKAPHFLRQIFMLAMDGVWRISADRIVERIENRPNQNLPTGLSSRLKSGITISLELSGIRFFYQKPGFDFNDPVVLGLPEETDEKHKGPSTGLFMQFFFTEEEALEANKEEPIISASEIVSFRDRNPDGSIEVLKAIGADHPVFVIARNGKTAFPNYWYEGAGIGRGGVPRVPKVVFKETVEKPELEKEKTPSVIPVVTLEERRESKKKAVVASDDNWLKSVLSQLPGHSLPDTSELKSVEPTVEAKPPAGKMRLAQMTRVVKQLPKPVQQPPKPVTPPSQNDTRHDEIVSLVRAHPGAIFIPMQQRIFVTLKEPKPGLSVRSGNPFPVVLEAGRFEVLHIKSPLLNGEIEWWIQKDQQGIIGERMFAFLSWAESNPEKVKIERVPK